MPKRQVKGLDFLRVAIRSMTPRTQLYKVLKEELTARGYWRNLPRGNPSKGYHSMKAKHSP